MRAVVQRVNKARVEVAGEVVGRIGRGLCVFVGAGKDDEDWDVDYVADKVIGLRIFTGEDGKMSLALGDIGGAVLAISQFTVYGDVRRGRRPSFDRAMEPVRAEAAYQRFVERLRAASLPVETGRFAANMRVVVDNDGPVTILVDSKKQF